MRCTNPLTHSMQKHSLTGLPSTSSLIGTGDTVVLKRPVLLPSVHEDRISSMGDFPWIQQMLGLLCFTVLIRCLEGIQPVECICHLSQRFCFARTNSNKWFNWLVHVWMNMILATLWIILLLCILWPIMRTNFLKFTEDDCQVDWKCHPVEL